MRRFFALGVCVSVLVAYAGCGDSARPPIVGTDSPVSGGQPADDAAAPGFSLDGGGPPPCPTLPDGGVCGCLDLPLLGDPPNLYFVLDRSGSMTELGKWDTVRAVIGDVIRKLGPRGRFGAAVFPDPRQDGCSAGIEVMAPTQGDVPAGTYGPTFAAFNLSTRFSASGGTPTAATLTALTTKLAALEGKTFIILATDGGPNCDESLTCDASTCIPNIEAQSGCVPNALPNCCAQEPRSCLDVNASVAAVAGLKSAGVPTYVIGVPGSGPYANVLQSMAIAGGTARYYDVTSADQSAFASALSSIAAKITATCSFPLGRTPPDPALVNVYFDGSIVPGNPVNGWTISGGTVTLVGAACSKVLAGEVLEIRVVAGCPTIVN